MLLTITAIGRDIAMSDPFPTEGALVVGALAGNSKSFHVSPSQLDRLLPQLTALEPLTLGDAANTPLMSWSVDSSEGDDREFDGTAGAVQELTSLHANKVATGGGSGLVIRGKNLLANQVKALATIGKVVYTAIKPGSGGNLVTVNHVVSGNNTSLSCTVSTNDITVHLATDGGGVATSTQTGIAALIAADSAAKYLVIATGGSTVAAAATKTHLKTGKGPGVSVTVGKDACSIASMTATALTVDVPSLTEGVSTDLGLVKATIGTRQLSLAVPLGYLVGTGEITAAMLAASASFTSTVTAVKTSAYNAVIGDLVQCDPSGGTFAVTLPAVASGNKGQAIIIKNVHATSATLITISRTGSDTIDGATSAKIQAVKGVMALVSDGTSNWDVIETGTATGLITATSGAESAHNIDTVCALTDSRGNALAVATEVFITAFSVTDNQGGLAAATSAVGTLNKAKNPATGPANAWMTTTSGGLFSFKVTDTAAEHCVVMIVADGCKPKLLNLTFAG